MKDANSEIQEKNESQAAESESRTALINDVFDSGKREAWHIENGKSDSDQLPGLAIDLEEKLPSKDGSDSQPSSTDVAKSILNGDIEDIQKVVAEVKTPEDYVALQKAVEEAGEKYKLDIELSKNENGEPVLNIQYRSHPFSYDIEVAADSATARSTLTGGFNPRSRPSHGIDPEEALLDLQEQRRND